MTLWISIGIMCLLATLFVARPLFRQQQRLTALISVCVLAIVAVSLGLYAYQGRPGIPSGPGAGTAPDIEAMVTSLAARLQKDPDDIEGWKMLGRSYMTLQNFPAAVTAYERAVELEEGQVAQTLVDLGTAILTRDNARVEGQIAALFESALALEPNNPSALFYAGIAALNRDNTDLAADRWEILLSLNPPENIRGVVQQRVAEWRGETAPVVAPQNEQLETSITADIAVAENVAAEVPGDASVFIIARDPAQPSPPIAVTRRRLSELPASIMLSDADSMIPGRNLSAFAEVELIARVSVSGEPIAQSGDWFGSTIIKPAENAKISLLIDQQVP
jgi:cytochrome c-type biogenesis protein CcmH